MVRTDVKRNRRRTWTLAATMAAWLFMAGLAPRAWAQTGGDAPPAGARDEYQRDVAACQDGRPDDQRAACLREAAAAQAERARGVLGQDDRALRENARLRCEPLPPELKADCLARVDGLGTSQGSVQEGAIIRETVTTHREIRGPGPIVPVEVK